MKIEVTNILNELNFYAELQIFENEPTYYFCEIDNFPETRGVYIIYDDKIDEIIYVGIAYEQNRTIKIRCQQYLWKGDGGTFRKKLGNRLGLSEDKAIQYIEHNCKAWCIQVDSGKTIKEIKRIEHLLIGLINPIDND